MNKQSLKPGQIAPTTGQYGVYGPRGGDLGREVTTTRGEPMAPPPTPHQTYRLKDAPKHQGE